MKLQRLSFLSASIVAALTLGFAPQGFAQDDDPELEEVIITGTRAKARSATESPAPVDVISGSEFVNQGGTDLSNLIRNVVPSYNVNSQPISDASTIVRPANLRGLAPDHTLVLINGKRRHRAAVIYWLGNGVADGAQGPDISAIPAIALKQVEVLRDGSAAQYGSDAIAGVMNFILKDDSEGASVEARYGTYYEGDGDLFTISGNVGLPFSDNGFANLSFEYGSADPTDRSVQRADAAALIAAGNLAVANPAQVWGTPEVDDEIKLFANVGLDVTDTTEFYSFGNYVTKTVEGGFYFRNPNSRGGVFTTDVDPDGMANSGDEFRNRIVVDTTGNMTGNCPVLQVPNSGPGAMTTVAADAAALAALGTNASCFAFNERFPGGFTPKFGGDYSDAALLAGIRGELPSGLNWDFSIGGGRNEVDFFIKNTVNASLGPASPTQFKPGAYIQFDRTVNLDFGYAPSANTNLAFGAEHRNEQFEIRVGEEASFERGPYATQGLSVASNGFPGFGNLAGGQFSRENIALYVDGEWEPTDSLLLGAAIRWEDYQDFGTTTNYKIAANWRATEAFGVRATYSTGFKAPTPGQSNAYNVSTEFDFTINDLVNNGTIPSTTPVAALRGGRALKPEDATNYTAGVFFNVGPADVTIDYFNIDVEDRLNLSNNFSLNAMETAQLEAQGFTAAGALTNFRFFVNDFDTETTGFDIVATLPLEWSSSRTDVVLNFNSTKTKVTRSGGTIDATRIREIEDGLPETRWNLTGTHYMGPWRILARASYYDDWFDSEDGNVYSGETLFDVEGGYEINEKASVVLGISNLGDTQPDENPGAAAGVGNTYSQFSPFGFNGGFYYGRFNYTF